MGKTRLEIWYDANTLRAFPDAREIKTEEKFGIGFLTFVFGPKNEQCMVNLNNVFFVDLIPEED